MRFAGAARARLESISAPRKAFSRSKLDLVELARSLISFRTEVPPGNEKGCASFIKDFLADLHVDDTELRLDTFEEGRANLIARLGPREPGLLLSGHLDVVPAGEESK